MTPQKVLIFGIDHERVSSALQNLLDPHFSVHVQLESEPTTDSTAVHLVQSLEQCIQKEKPGLVFLVISTDELTESKELLTSLQNSKTPVIAVTEAGDCERMFELFKDGAADFVIPPLSPANVLPRAWRLLELNRTKPESANAIEGDLGLKRLIGKSAVFLSQVNNIPLIAK